MNHVDNESCEQISREIPLRSIVIDDDSDFENVFNNNIQTSIRRQPLEVAQPQRKRPSVVTNKYPERDCQEFRSKRIVPGNSSYANMTQNGKKIGILSDSICSGLPIGKLNKALKNKHAYKRVFPGANPEDIQYYCVRTLENEKPDIAVIHAGTNCVGEDDQYY